MNELTPTMCNFFKISFSALFLFLTATLLLPAQITDDFSDGDLNSNPAWLGDTANFVVNGALELQLNAPAAGSSSLFTHTGFPYMAAWEIYLRMEFDPSSSNRLRIYLFSNSENLLTGSGYFLQIGEDGSADAIKLYRQDEGNAKLLASATAGAVAVSPHLRLRVTRENGAHWKLEADYSGAYNFSAELETTDATYEGAAGYFGLHCTYTTTRKDKFFFDDISIPEPVPDTLPPVLVAAKATSAVEIDVFFDEPLEEITATEPAHFSINNGIGEPAAAFQDEIEKHLIHLSLMSPLVNLTEYTLTTQGVSDLNGNVSPAQEIEFSFIETADAEEYDVLINEIMADPTPPVTLPQVEFIELFNNSDKVIDLAGFTFSTGGTPQVFPSALMLPGSYLIVCDATAVDSLAIYGTVVALPKFPTLVNTAGSLTLTNALGRVIHHLSYDIAWYKNSQKSQGGWTLELINPLAPCAAESNWIASVNLAGGTPGKPNSVFAPVPDQTGPQLTRIFAQPEKPDEISLFFNERLDRDRATDPTGYQLVPDVPIVSASLLSPSEDIVLLKLASSLEQSRLYQVAVREFITDCIGNPMTDVNSLSLALPELPQPQDLVINEILFNPVTGGFDFLEIYNRSKKILNLGDLIIGNISKGGDTILIKVVENRLIFPGEYAVFSDSPSDIRERYFVKNEKSLILNKLPAFNDKEGNATILRGDTSGVVILDAFDYQESMHHSLLKDFNGVSLERLSPNRPTQDRSNWHSAAAAAGFATPTYQNSQLFEMEATGDDLFQIAAPVFSPDGDGYQDFIAIYYKMDKPGYTATIKVFDAEGRPIKSLINNELLAAEGFIRWDGDTNEGTKARVGVYVVWIQLFNPDGSKKEYKRAVVLAARL